MPGFDTERFVSLSQNDKAELICSICQDIFRSPLVAQCCQQAFCEDCINDWLKNNNTCPYDRKEMTASGLSRPPRLMLNMLGKLNIYCDFKENGCKEVLLLEDLSQHILKCEYNVQNCEKCLCEIQDKSSHDCIKTLLELNLKANKELESLKGDYSANILQYSLREQSFLSEICQLKTEKETLVKENGDLKVETENLLKTVQDLSNNTEQQKSSKSRVFSNFEPEIFSQAKKAQWDPQLIQNFMSEDITNKVLSVVRNEILREHNTSYSFCKFIVDKLNTEFGSNWHSIVSHQKPIKAACSYDPGYFIVFKLNELFLQIFRTSSGLSSFKFEELSQRLRDGKIKREIKILRTDMKQNMISDVKNITFEAIDKSNSLSKLSNEMRTQMDKLYPGKWLCFIYSDLGSFSIMHKCDTHIHFEMDSLTMTLFQACV